MVLHPAETPCPGEMIIHPQEMTITTLKTGRKYQNKGLLWIISEHKQENLHKIKKKIY